MNKKFIIYGILIFLITVCFTIGYTIGNKASLETQKKIEEMQKK